MNRSVALGLVYGAATPVALAVIATTFVTGGNLFSILPGAIAIVISAPVAIGFTLIFGIPLYFAYRRLRVASFSAYIATGLALSLPVAALLLWGEYSGGYVNARQALLLHTIEFICLLSGPAATAVFWRFARPDMPDAQRARVSVVPLVCREAYDTTLRRLGLVAVGVLMVGWFVFSTYMEIPKKKAPLATEYFTFDSMKSAALIASLNEYASSRSAHLDYYFMPVHPPENLSVSWPPVDVSATLNFPDGIEIVVMNPTNRGFAAIYSESNIIDEHSKQIWSDFLSYLGPAVDNANSLPLGELPNIASWGEGGVRETHWWDWRFHRQ
jgi:hypothetical protein